MGARAAKRYRTGLPHQGRVRVITNQFHPPVKNRPARSRANRRPAMGLGRGRLFLLTSPSVRYMYGTNNVRWSGWSCRIC